MRLLCCAARLTCVATLCWTQQVLATAPPVRPWHHAHPRRELRTPACTTAAATATAGAAAATAADAKAARR